MKIKATKPLILLFTAIVLVSLACSIDLYGTPTPAPQPLTDPSAQPEQLAATFQPEQSFTDAQQFYTEEFDAETDTWKYLVVNGAKKQIVNGIVGLMSVRPIGGLLILICKARVHGYTPHTNHSLIRMSVSM